jgi:hypothetical protein
MPESYEQTPPTQQSASDAVQIPVTQPTAVATTQQDYRENLDRGLAMFFPAVGKILKAIVRVFSEVLGMIVK